MVGEPALLSFRRGTPFTIFLYFEKKQEKSVREKPRLFCCRSTKVVFECGAARLIRIEFYFKAGCT